MAATKEPLLVKMIVDVEEKLEALQTQLAAGGMTDAAEAAAWKTIDDQLTRIKRIRDINARIAEMKKRA